VHLCKQQPLKNKDVILFYFLYHPQIENLLSNEIVGVMGRVGGPV
jgi:hypothetical protein